MLKSPVDTISLLGLCGVIMLFFSCSSNSELQVTSSDGSIHIDLMELQDGLHYTLHVRGKEIINSSEISIFPGIQPKVVSSKVIEVKKEWEPVWGQFSSVTDHYKELIISLDYDGIVANLIVRVYNEGVGLRFEAERITPESKPLYLMEYALGADDQIFMPAGEREPLGPIQVGSLSKAEFSDVKMQMPIVVDTKNGTYLSLLESDLISSPGFDVINFGFDKQKQRIISSNTLSSAEDSFKTPWRVILAEENLGDLVISALPLNLATPCMIDDPSWIKPGKTLWDWRVHGYIAPDGFTYGINTESYLRFVNFAAENQIEYFLIDDAWFSDVSENAIIPNAKLDMSKIIRYAEEKSVSLILYYDRRKGDFGDKDLFPYYQEMGMNGIKYGFMGSNVPFTRDAIKLSAESKLLIDFHDGPVPFTGISRTYPNAITREYNHAQQDSRRAFTPEAFIKMALINAIQGPLDMNNGIFDIKGVNAGLREKGPLKHNSLFTTVTAEAARTLIIFSGLVCLPDAPEVYMAKGDLFDFIKKLPVGRWDESKIINAQMGEYITTARRSGKDWFIGSVHSAGGILEIPMDFLESGIKYKATFYEDSDETDSVTNPEAYQIREGNMVKGDLVQASIAKGGGHCMWIRAE